MSKTKKAVIIIISIVIAIAILFFGGTAIGRAIWNTYWHDVQKSDEITYDMRREVENTARSYISSYNTDVDIYNTYCNSDDENLKAYAESARMRAIQTANSYNEFLQKNSYVWRDNMPEDLPNTLSTQLGTESE